jgi:hypothetical protein
MSKGRRTPPPRNRVIYDPWSDSSPFTMTEGEHQRLLANQQLLDGCADWFIYAVQHGKVNDGNLWANKADTQQMIDLIKPTEVPGCHLQDLYAWQAGNWTPAMLRAWGGEDATADDKDEGDGYCCLWCWNLEEHMVLLRSAADLGYRIHGRGVLFANICNNCKDHISDTGYEREDDLGLEKWDAEDAEAVRNYDPAREWLLVLSCEDKAKLYRVKSEASR